MNNAQAKRMAFTEHGEGTEIFRDKGLKKQRWYSICSVHFTFNKDCNMCNTGSWENVWMLAISGWFYKHFTKLWVWWVNNI